MFSNNLLMAAGGAKVGPAVVTYIGTETPFTGNASVYTFSGASIGTASADRIVVVFSGSSSGTTPSSIAMTVGGINCTIIDTTASESRYAIGYAVVPTGTTADIVVTFGSDGNFCGCAVWTVTQADTTAHDSDTLSLPYSPSGNALSQTSTLDVPAGGVVIAAVEAGYSSSESWTWTNIDEDLDESIDAGARQSGGSKAYAEIQTGLVITGRRTAEANNLNQIAISFGPA